MTVLELDECACGQPATRTLGARPYCDECAEEVLAPIRKRVARRDGVGYGEQTGRRRPDWGYSYADLTCNLCGATWTGPMYERCHWCQDALERMQAWQAEMLLDPDLPDAADERYKAACEAWAERLGRGVRSALVTEQQAMAALQRQARR